MSYKDNNCEQLLKHSENLEMDEISMVDDKEPTGQRWDPLGAANEESDSSVIPYESELLYVYLSTIKNNFFLIFFLSS